MTDDAEIADELIRSAMRTLFDPFEGAVAELIWRDGWTQREIAAELGVDAPAVQAAVRSMLHKLCEVPPRME